MLVILGLILELILELILGRLLGQSPLDQPDRLEPAQPELC
jgi:hypothetical protein